MKGFDGQLATLDCDMLMGSDRRMLGARWSLSERGMYGALVGLAFRECREVLPIQYSCSKSGAEMSKHETSLRVLGTKIVADVRTLAKFVAKLQQECCNSDARMLIDVNELGRIRVCGVRDKRPRHPWRPDDELFTIWGGIGNGIGTVRDGIVKEQAQPRQKTSATRPDFDAVREAIRRNQKNTGQKPSLEVVQKILNLCREKDLDPVGVIELAEKPLKNPVAWMQAACRDPDCWLDRAGGWGKFQQRLNYARDGPVTLDTTGPEDMAGIIQRAMRDVKGQGGTG
jgi:hypothetical protein